MGSMGLMEPGDITSYAGNSDVMRNFTTVCMSVGRLRSQGLFSGSNPLNFTFPLLLVQLSMSSGIVLLINKLLRPLGQPIIIPQILSGIILGPSVLGRSSDFTNIFFPLRSFIVLDALARFGYMFYFFLVGVQIDPWILKKMEKKTCVMGISTVGFPLILSTAGSILIPRFISVSHLVATSLPVVALTESVLSFPIITQFLSELKIVNSEFGRVAMCSSVASNLFSFCVITLTILLKEETEEKYKILSTICTGIAFAMVVAFVIRPAILWMIRQNPEGEPLKEECIYAVFTGVLMIAFCSQVFGLHLYFGPLVLGIAIPAGPPLGSALVEKLELINSWLFMPFFFVKNGLVINTFGVRPKNYVAVQFVIFLGCTGKFLGAFLSSLIYKMPLKDAAALGLVMNAQGIIELGMFKMMRRAKAISNGSFVVMCTSMVIVTGVITPIIRHLYDPSRRYIVYKRRTVMHTRPNSELRVLVCIHDHENVPATINLLEAFNPTKRSPVVIYVLHLIQLVGRANPLLIAHKLTKRPSSKASPSERIVNAFRYYEQSNLDSIVSVHPYTAISSYATMHDNVCTIALDKRTSLVIVPYHKKLVTNAAMQSSKKGIQIMNYNVLDKAPCSTAILVDRGLLNCSRPILASWSSYRVAVLFLGGADDREALALATRMAGHPNINLTMVRLLENGNITSDDMRERKLDNELVSEFRMSMAGNYRVVYIEEVVMDGPGTVAVIRSMENKYELIVVGRRHNKRSPLTLGITDWNEHTDLGAIGDILASADFRGNTTVLVVQQHTNVANERHEDQLIDILREKNLNMFQDRMVEEEAEDVPIQRRSM